MILLIILIIKNSKIKIIKMIRIHLSSKILKIKFQFFKWSVQYKINQKKKNHKLHMDVPYLHKLLTAKNLTSN